ncbi:hypothetical protein BY458DRAFT_566457 [Sporodiniella umbellata]|nr:hypothetical protein BY458DRAFT_566457 [Sporodiniella umbellata]
MSCKLVYKKDLSHVYGVDCEWDITIQDLWTSKPAEPKLSLVKLQESRPDLSTQMLFSQALLESHGFEFMSFSELELLKDEYKSLQQHQKYIQQCAELERRLCNIDRSWSTFPCQKINVMRNRCESVESQIYFIRQSILKHSSAVLCKGISLQIKESEEIKEYANKVIQKFDSYIHLKKAEHKLNLLCNNFEKLLMRRKGLLAERDQYKAEYRDLNSFFNGGKEVYFAGIKECCIAQKNSMLSGERKNHKNRELQIQSSNQMHKDHSIQYKSIALVQQVTKQTKKPNAETIRAYKNVEDQILHKQDTEQRFSDSTTNYRERFDKAKSLDLDQVKHHEDLKKLTTKAQRLRKKLAEEKVQAARASNPSELREKLQIILSGLQVNYEQRLKQEVRENQLLEKKIEFMKRQSVNTLYSI